MEKKDEVSRAELLALIKGGNAHMSFDDAVEDFPESKMNALFPNGTYTPWHLIEHIRRSQLDILEFMRNPDYKEMKWPDDYWPEKEKRATKKEWEETIAKFHKDTDEILALLNDPKTDLSAKIPHGDGQTMLREFLLIADHNAYHVGEFAIMRQVMGTWGKNHKS